MKISQFIAPARQQRTHLASYQTASFTLIEIVVAMALFFAAGFALLNLIGTNLRILRSLYVPHPDMGSVATELTLALQTNRDVSALNLSGDFGEVFPGATWSAQLTVLATNSGVWGKRAGGLYQVNLSLQWKGAKTVQNQESTFWIYLPRGLGPK